MKKITILVACFLASTAITKAQTVQLPAAYYNNSATTQGEYIDTPSDGVRNTNIVVPFTGTYYTNGAEDDMIYDNGPYYNVDGPPTASLLESVTLGMNTLGAGAQLSAGNSVADDVTLPGNYNVTSIDFFAYQTNTPAPSITAIYVQVYDDDPSAGGSVIWGDLTTDILDDAVSADTNRYSETNIGDNSRQITRAKAATDGLTLLANTTYWIEVTFDGTGSSGPWAPPIVILGEATTGNGLQYQSSLPGWVILEDSGTFTPQGIPFIMYGTEILDVEDNALAGFNYFPNPTTDVMHVTASKSIEKVSVYNLLGQEVMNRTIGATSSDLNLGGLAAGTYVMHVIINGQTGTYKITKQ